MGNTIRRILQAGFCLMLCAALTRVAPAADHPLLIVAAENFYGELARQLAGSGVQVISVLQNPDADPHVFEPDTATARLVADADVLIYNGAQYDPWMQRLLGTAGRHARRTLEVAALMHRQDGHANPHLWYDPQTMPVLARALTSDLQQLDPASASQYAARLAAFQASLQPVTALIARLRRQYAGTPVTATEPVANDLTAAIGLTMYNDVFQLAIMNDTEPGPRETARFEQSLRSRTVRVLIYNRQTDGELVRHLVQLARQAGIPRVGVTETEPVGTDYARWMTSTLQALGTALSGAQP